MDIEDMNQTRKVQRNSNLELLRFIATIFITINHISSKGIGIGNLDVVEAGNINTFLALFFYSLGKFGCNLFLLITIWYLKERNVKWKNIVSVWFQTFAYYFVFNVIFMTLNGKMDIKKLVMSVFPLLSSNYWYSRAYIVLLFLYPIVICIFAKLKWRNICIAIMGFATFIPISAIFIEEPDFMHYIIRIITRNEVWFIFFAVAIFYVRANNKLDKIRPEIYLLWSCLLIIAMTVGMMILLSFGMRFSELRNLTSPLNYISAFFMFMCFKNMPCRNNIMLLKLARYSFGIYLFQCNANVQGVIFNKIHAFYIWLYKSNSLLFFGGCIVITLGIILLGLIVDYVYQCLFYHTFVTKVISKLEMLIDDKKIRYLSSYK